MRLNLYSFIDLKSEYNTKETINTFVRFFYTFGRFPGIQELATIPIVEVLDFVKAIEIISPANLYKNFSSGNTRGLVCAQFLAFLDVRLGSESKTSEDNLSVQTSSRSNDNILLKFDAINKLNKSINNLLQSIILTFEKKNR